MPTMPVLSRVLIRAAMAAALGALLASAATVPAHASDTGADWIETPPDGDDRLTLPELRWCRFESTRLDGELHEVIALDNWGLETYEARAGSYRYNCTQKNFSKQDQARIENELTPETRLALRKTGAARISGARADWEARRVHVRDEAARVRARPGTLGRVLGMVPRWGTLISTGRAEGPWLEVEWRNPPASAARTVGWVLGTVLGRGSGIEARIEYCERHAGRRARHSEIVQGELAFGLASWIKVENGADRDAYLKLLVDPGAVALGFLVGAGQTALLKGIPKGSYAVAFALGSRFSRGCDSFSDLWYARRFDRRLDYDSRTAGWTLSLHGEDDGDAGTSALSHDEFDRL